MNEIEKVVLPRFPGCFVCGPDNDHGLNLPFYGFTDRVEARWSPQLPHIGYAQTIHGGILSTVLDEAVIWAAYHLAGRFGVTAELNIRFKRPVNVGENVLVTGCMTETGKRLWTAEAKLVNMAEKVLVSAVARIHPLSVQKTAEMLNNLDHGFSSI
ncbi:PaaI family thioesterase [bacterium]|nr:PaaI family thioesterase [bacterium]